MLVAELKRSAELKTFPMIKRLKKITPLQSGKMLAVVYGLGSLLFVPFFLLAGLFASFAPKSQGAPPMPGFLGFGMVFILLAPVLYVFMGFITGIIGAYIYNLVAKWIGGIEFEVE